MFYGYEKAKRISKREKKKVSLLEINQLSKKYFGKEFSKKEVVMIVQGIAAGRISSPMNCLPFKRMIEKHPNQKVLLQGKANELFDQMILFTYGLNCTLYINASVSKKSMPYYHQFLKILHSKKIPFVLKEVAQAINPMKEDQNIWNYLENRHQEILMKYGFKDQVVTQNDILFAKSYEIVYQNSFSEQHQLVEEFESFLKEKNIERVEICNNEIYNMMKSYVLSFEEKVKKHEIVEKDVLSKMESLYKQMKRLFGQVDFVIEYRHLLQKIKDHNVVFTIETYDHTKESFQEFCSRHRLSYQTILTRIDRVHDKQLLEQVKFWLEESKRMEKLKEEEMLQHFIDVLTKIVKHSDTTFFTLAHYYSITSYSLDQMVRYLEHQGYHELHKFLFHFYCKHLEEEKSYKKVKIEKDVDIINLVKAQITSEQFPKKLGLFYQAYDMYEKGILSQFTKAYYLKDLDYHLMKKDEKVKQKVQI